MPQVIRNAPASRIGQTSERNAEEGVEYGEARAHEQTHLGVVDTQVFLDWPDQQSQDLPVDEREDVGQREQADDKPRVGGVRIEIGIGWRIGLSDDRRRAGLWRQLHEILSVVLFANGHDDPSFRGIFPVKIGAAGDRSPLREQDRRRSSGALSHRRGGIDSKLMSGSRRTGYYRRCITSVICVRLNESLSRHGRDWGAVPSDPLVDRRSSG